MNRRHPWFNSGLLLAFVFLVTGCPSNFYVVELTPNGSVMHRRLTFWRQDGMGTNMVPNYSQFPTNELAEIRRVYPRGAVKAQSDPYTAEGDFGNLLPADIDSAGYFTNYTSTMGSAGSYMERFRGEDDLASKMALRFKAADKIADLAMGWTRAEFGHEKHYADLKKFLDTDFRRDLKNASLYLWMGQSAATHSLTNGIEFAPRFAQFLLERGYLKVEDMPDLIADWTGSHDQRIGLLVQKLVARKLGVKMGAPMPKSLKLFEDPAATGKSIDKYLAGTERYHQMLWEWKKAKLFGTYLKKDYVAQQMDDYLHPGRKKAPASGGGPPRPEPGEVLDELGMQLLQFELFGTDDQLTVKLALPSPPWFSNGKWDETNKVVNWQFPLETKPEFTPLPAFACATWAVPDEAFQKKHFGKVVLVDGELTLYCVWRDSLGAGEASEWEAFLNGLEPGEGLQQKVNTFSFKRELTGVVATNAPPSISQPARDLLVPKLNQKAE